MPAPDRCRPVDVNNRRPTRRQVIGAVTGAAGLIAAGGFSPAGAAAAGGPTVSARPRPRDSSRVGRWARDTWHCLDVMTDERTGLVADNSSDRLAAGDRSGWTSPTNIGGMLWSIVVARELGLISHG